MFRNDDKKRKLKYLVYLERRINGEGQWIHTSLDQGFKAKQEMPCHRVMRLKMVSTGKCYQPYFVFHEAAGTESFIWMDRQNYVKISLLQMCLLSVVPLWLFPRAEC